MILANSTHIIQYVSPVKTHKVLIFVCFKIILLIAHFVAKGALFVCFSFWLRVLD